MPMKTSDLKTAVALLLQGYLRANDEMASALHDAIVAVRTEVDDWAENFSVPAGLDANALEPNQRWTIEMRLGQADVPRTPYNLQSAALVLLAESIDLIGPEAVPMMLNRITDSHEAPAEEVPAVRTVGGMPYEA